LSKGKCVALISAPQLPAAVFSKFMSDIPRNLKIFTTYWFLTGLLILLLNDFFFKEHYGNWLTGKLSDFSGLFIFPLFWTAIFPGHKNKIFWLTGLMFAYFKSPFSQAFIDNWNSIGLLSISRTVDYSDLCALIILPVAFSFESSSDSHPKISLNPIIPLTIATFAFLATNSLPTTCFQDSAIYYVKHYSRDSLISDLKASGIYATTSEYVNTKYKDENWEINNLNDSIYSLIISIGDFNSDDNTVKISLGCWDYNTKISENDLDKATLERQEDFVRGSFEKEVIRKIEKNYH